MRDSNSFPGAFGLALKVATPPPNKGDKVIVNEGTPYPKLFLKNLPRTQMKLHSHIEKQFEIAVGTNV